MLIIKPLIKWFTNIGQYAQKFITQEQLQLYFIAHGINANLLANKTEIEWAQAVCKKLQVLYLLKGMGVTYDDSTFIRNNMVLLHP